MAVGIVAYKLCIAYWIELSHQWIAFADVNRIPISVVAVKLQQGCRHGTLVHNAPSGCRNILQRAVQQHAFGMWIVLSFIVWQPAQLSKAAETYEMAVDEDVAVVLLCVANPHESAAACNGAMVEERRPASQHGVTAAVDAAVMPVAATVGL